MLFDFQYIMDLFRTPPQSQKTYCYAVGFFVGIFLKVFLLYLVKLKVRRLDAAGAAAEVVKRKEDFIDLK